MSTPETPNSSTNSKNSKSNFVPYEPRESVNFRRYTKYFTEKTIYRFILFGICFLTLASISTMRYLYYFDNCWAFVAWEFLLILLSSQLLSSVILSIKYRNDNLKKVFNSQSTPCKTMEILRIMIPVIESSLEMIRYLLDKSSFNEQTSLDLMVLSTIEGFFKKMIRVAKNKDLISDFFDFDTTSYICKVNLYKSVESVISVLSYKASARNVILRNEVNVKLPNLSVPEDHLTAILYILIYNSLKNTESGTVIVSAKKMTPQMFPRFKPLSRLEITITDTGNGLSKDQLTDPWTTLGMSCVNHLVGIFGGRISIRCTGNKSISSEESCNISFNNPLSSGSSSSPVSNKIIYSGNKTIIAFDLPFHMSDVERVAKSLPSRRRTMTKITFFDDDIDECNQTNNSFNSIGSSTADIKCTTSENQTFNININSVASQIVFDTTSNTLITNEHISPFPPKRIPSLSNNYFFDKGTNPKSSSKNNLIHEVLQKNDDNNILSLAEDFKEHNSVLCQKDGLPQNQIPDCEVPFINCNDEDSHSGGSAPSQIYTSKSNIFSPLKKYNSFCSSLPRETEICYKVLVVDDDFESRGRIATYLSNKSNVFEATFCGSTKECIQTLSHWQPDIILMEVFQDGSGFECITEIRKKYDVFQLPILVVSNIDSDELMIQSFEVGANDFILKPIRKNYLVARIRALLHITTMTISVSRFVPNEFLVYLDRPSITDIELGDNVQKEMTILFADIRNFTSISESITASETFKFINAYLACMGPIISKNSGFIDKYIGDAIMALFGGGVENSIRAAIDMQRALERYNEKTKRSNNSIPIRIGIGIHTGDVVLGTVGYADRMETSVLSDSVNLASRLEGVTKEYHAGIIISAETYAKINNDNNDNNEFNIRFLGHVAVKGKKIESSIYEVFDFLPEDIKIKYEQSKYHFEIGVDCFLKKQYVEAMENWKQVLKTNPDDLATKMYMERCQKVVRFLQ